MIEARKNKKEVKYGRSFIDLHQRYRTGYSSKLLKLRFNSKGQTMNLLGFTRLDNEESKNRDDDVEDRTNQAEPEPNTQPSRRPVNNALRTIGVVIVIKEGGAVVSAISIADKSRDKPSAHDNHSNKSKDERDNGKDTRDLHGSEFLNGADSKEGEEQENGSDEDEDCGNAAHGKGSA